MSVSQIPAKSTSAGAVVAAAPSANSLYSTPVDLIPGIYTVSCASTTVTNIAFWADSELVTTAITISGLVTVSIGEAITDITYWTNTGSNIQISIELIGVPLAAGVSGTLDTITTTGTYTGVGYGYAVIVAGGQRGFSGYQQSSFPNYDIGGNGGGSGGVVVYSGEFTGSMPVTIGAGGTGSAGALGGSTSFAGITVDCRGTGFGNGGTYNGPAGAASASGAPAVFGTTGGGGAGAGIGSGTSPGGSGIGRGGSGGANGGNVGSPGTGYGSGGGGGGGGTANAAGGDGAPGVVYVLRFT